MFHVPTLKTQPFWSLSAFGRQRHNILSLHSVNVLQSVTFCLSYACDSAHTFILSCRVMFLNFVGARGTGILSTAPSELGYQANRDNSHQHNRCNPQFYVSWLPVKPSQYPGVLLVFVQWQLVHPVIIVLCWNMFITSIQSFSSLSDAMSVHFLFSVTTSHFHVTHSSGTHTS